MRDHLMTALSALCLAASLAAGATLHACSGSPARSSGEQGGWFPFSPEPSAVAGSAIDMRFLNEKFAGEHGFISVRDGQFVRSGDGKPMRFWAVNILLQDLDEPDFRAGGLRAAARLLARRGVNMVRLPGPVFDGAGEVDPARVRRAIEAVEAMKAEGIYTHFSIYFPLWLAPRPGTPWLLGYDGTRKPFAALFFNPAFQAHYRKWWAALLTTPSPTTHRPLVDDPAVASLEMQNEDSFFFWTFDTEAMPDAQARILETAFGDWLRRRYGSLDAAMARWNHMGARRDTLAAGRVGFRPLRSMLGDRTPRDQDTARFLLETQTRFYAETRAFLRGLGFKGPITASNWHTADSQVLGPLEKLSYTAGDFLDRHGYFDCHLQGPESDWSIRSGDTYTDRSALRFDPDVPGGPKDFWSPAMDWHYDGKPSMISETTWSRPNRFRSEAPLFLAAYGALQGSDAIVHFMLDGTRWAVKPRYFQQPWTLMTPAMMGQFPAAALVFRRGLVAPGRVLAEIDLQVEALRRLEGTPFPERPPDWRPGQGLDPLLHFAGRVQVRFTSGSSSMKLVDVRSLMDRASQTVTSSTGELRLDYGKGMLVLDAPRAQGLSGRIAAAGTVRTRDLVISSDMQVGHVVAVSLDDRPLATSRRILLQVMSEERPSGFRTAPLPGGLIRILDIGHDPWLVRELGGTVSFTRPDAAALRVTALDLDGHPAGSVGDAATIALRPSTAYYLISP